MLQDGTHKEVMRQGVEVEVTVSLCSGSGSHPITPEGEVLGYSCGSSVQIEYLSGGLDFP